VSRNLILSLVIAALLAGSELAGAGQTPGPKPKPKPKVVDNTIGRSARVAVGTFGKPLQPNWSELVFRTRVRGKEPKTRITWSDVYARAPFTRWELNTRKSYYNNQPYETLKHRMQVYTAAGNDGQGTRPGARIHALIAGGVTWPGKGNGGSTGSGGHVAHKRAPNWFSLAVDLDVDVDSNRDGKIATDNSSEDANREDAIEASDPVGAMIGYNRASGDALVIRPLMAKWESKIRKPSSFLDAKLYFEFVEGSVGQIDVIDYVTGDSHLEASLPLVDDKPRMTWKLKDSLLKKVLDGKDDLKLALKGKWPGKLEVDVVLVVKPKGGDVKPTVFRDRLKLFVWDVKFVPYVDINDKIVRDETGKIVDTTPKAGRGEVPNIPMNGILPKRLSGTGKKNEVRVALRVIAPPGEYKFRVQLAKDQGRKLRLRGDSDINVTVPRRSHKGSPANTAYSNAGTLDSEAGTFIVFGVTKSKNKSDVGWFEAELKEAALHTDAGNETLDSIMLASETLLRYTFVLDIPDAYSGTASTIPDGDIAGDRKPNFNGDTILPQRIGRKDPLKGLTARGWENSTESLYFHSGVDVSPRTTRYTARGVLANSGGTTMAAYPKSRPVQRLVMYAKTSANPIELRRSIGGRYLHDGDLTDKLVLSSGYFYYDHAEKALAQRVVKAKNSTAKIGKARVLYHNIEEFDAWIHGPLFGPSRTLVKNNIETDFKHDPVLCVLKTEPRGEEVFSGEAFCELRVKRTGRYHLYAYSGANADEIVFTLVKAAPISYKGFDFGSLLHKFLLPASNGETLATFKTSLAVGLTPPKKDEYLGDSTVDTSRTPWRLKSVTRPETFPSAPVDQKLVKADGYILSAEKYLYNRSLTPRVARVDDPVVFRVQMKRPLGGVMQDASTALPIWTFSSVVTRKLNGHGFGYAILDLDPVQPYAEDDVFQVWSLSTGAN